MNILFLGKEWLGSNARGLAEGFRKLNHNVNLVNDDLYYPPMRSRFLNRVIVRLIRPIFIKEYNDEVLRQDSLMKPDLIVVAKGELLQSATLKEFKERGRVCVLFYPDTSFLDFGPRIPKCVPLYEKIFTTKPNFPDYLKSHFHSNNGIFMPHGADSDLHREIPYNESMSKLFSCEVSFIGNWSKKKEDFLSNLLVLNPNLDLKIWGPRWAKFSSSSNLNSKIMGIGVHGDLYVNAINYSNINLAILFEGNPKAPKGDTITSRTFHIPGSGGFMLHERTTDLLIYYKENEEVACFDSVEECSSKIKFYLNNDDKREVIRKAGHKRTYEENLMQNRAEFILNVLANKA